MVLFLNKKILLLINFEKEILSACDLNWKKIDGI